MQSTNPAQISTPARSEQQPFTESDLDDLALVMQQHIKQLASQCQQQVHQQVAEIWAATEITLASLPQRMVSDHLSMEDPAGLPYYHPVHWFRSQLEFKLRGILEFTDDEAAISSIPEVLNQLQPEIIAAIAVRQTDIVETFDRQIHDLRQALVPLIQPHLSDTRVIITEYINSHVPLAKIQLPEVDRFGFFLNGKRFVPSSIVIATTKTVRPWYLLGLQTKQVPCYQVSIEQLQLVVQESLDRSFQNMQTKITDYISHELHSQIQRLLANVA
jgi:predicted Zn-dependent protease with MMP-like domain